MTVADRNALTHVPPVAEQRDVSTWAEARAPLVALLTRVLAMKQQAGARDWIDPVWDEIAAALKELQP